MATRSMVSVAWVVLLASHALAQPLPIREIGLLPGDVSIAPAVSNQIDSHAARGGDQVLVVWTDYRSTSTGTEQSGMDILGIRLNPAGDPIDPVPFVICANAGWQQAPQATWNGLNWLVTFYSQDPAGSLLPEQHPRRAGVARRRGARSRAADAGRQSSSGSGSPGRPASGWSPGTCRTTTFTAPTSSGRRLGDNGQFLDPGPVMLMDWTYPGSGTPECLRPTGSISSSGRTSTPTTTARAAWASTASRSAISTPPSAPTSAATARSTSPRGSRGLVLSSGAR